MYQVRVPGYQYQCVCSTLVQVPVPLVQFQLCGDRGGSVTRYLLVRARSTRIQNTGVHTCCTSKKREKNTLSVFMEMMWPLVVCITDEQVGLHTTREN
jgi:hypothetical protein